MSRIVSHTARLAYPKLRNRHMAAHGSMLCMAEGLCATRSLCTATEHVQDSIANTALVSQCRDGHTIYVGAVTSDLSTGEACMETLSYSNQDRNLTEAPAF